MNISISLTYLSLIWTRAAALEEGFLMKFLVVSSSALFGFAAAAEDAYPASASLKVVSDISSVEVFPDIIIDHDAMYSTVEESTVPHRSSPGKFAGKARLLPSFFRTLQEKTGIFVVVDSTHVTNMRLMTESSELHIDRYEKRPEESPGRVGFVFLNTNPDAHFNHGQSSVPVVEGRMVLFDGGIPHNTIVNSGSVKLLGPFEVKSFIGVGDCSSSCFASCEAAVEACGCTCGSDCYYDTSLCEGYGYYTDNCNTCSPSENPSENPSKNPTSLPTSKKLRKKSSTSDDGKTKKDST